MGPQGGNCFQIAHSALKVPVDFDDCSGFGNVLRNHNGALGPAGIRTFISFFRPWPSIRGGRGENRIQRPGQVG